MDKFKRVVNFLKDKRIVIGICIIISSSFLVTCFGIYRLYFDRADNLETPEIIQEESIVEVAVNNEEINKEDIITYSVEIKGEVVKPGVYALDSDKRVIDVVNKAKGFTKNADSSVINLSKKIQDEMVIIVYSKKQVDNFVKTKEKEEIKQEICKQEYKIENDACLGKEDIINNKNQNTNSNTNANANINDETNIDDSKNIGNNSTKIPLNTATLEQLMTLNGIGESKARSIIDYRINKGKFNTIEDIMKVSGIGEALFEKIKDNITV